MWLNSIKRFFGIHVHNWGDWKITHTFVASRGGSVKVIQARQCTLCGKTEIDAQTTY